MKRSLKLRSILFLRMALIFVLFVCYGCGKVPVAQDINQGQANEIVAALNANGISAQSIRSAGSKALYSIEVRSRNYSRAISLLNKRKLPSKPKVAFTDLIAQRGIIPDSREIESLRIDHALGVQIEEVLDNHPGVVSAKAIVRLNYLHGDLKPGVSVVVQRRKTMTVDEAQLIEIISHAIPGLEDKDIYVAVHVAGEPKDATDVEGVLIEDDELIRIPLVSFPLGSHVPEDDYDVLALTIFAIMALVAIVGSVVGYWYAYFQQSKEVFDTDLSDLRPKSLKIEQYKHKLPEA